MKIGVAIMIGVMPMTALAGQVETRKSGAVVAADFNYGARVDACSVSGQGSGAVLSARLFVRFQPDQRLAAGDGVDIDVALPDGGAPIVTAHAINTKGAGSNNRMILHSCSANPGGGASRGVKPVATCDVSAGVDGATVTFTLPLDTGGAAKQYVGHVTLIKRGDPPGDATIVAPCSSSGASSRASWDLATLKK